MMSASQSNDQNTILARLLSSTLFSRGIAISSYNAKPQSLLEEEPEESIEEVQ